MEKITVSFKENFNSIEVEVGTPLADALDGPHSPVFFGCKSGNCGTCLVELDEVSYAAMSAANEVEKDMLDSIACDKPYARLACQLEAQTNMTLKYLN